VAVVQLCRRWLQYVEQFGRIHFATLQPGVGAIPSP
jgi:hypothetical protein